MSKLVHGYIPAKTECPFKNDCGFQVSGKCFHEGVNHTVKFSCGMARAFDLVERS